MNRIAFVVWLAACETKSEEPVDQDLASARLALRTVEEGLAKVQAGKAPVHENGMTPIGSPAHECGLARSAALQIRERGPDGKVLATRIERLCTYDVPIAVLERVLVEAEHIDDDLDRMIPCTAAHMPFETLVAHFPDDPKTRQLKARYVAFCALDKE